MASILVVEDEPHIRMLLTTILHKLRHEVTVAQDGAEALACLEHHSYFEMVITDLQMPQLDGLELLAILQYRYPTVPVIVMSAYRDRLMEALKKGASNLLQKPFSHQQLLEAVQKTLSPGLLSAALHRGETSSPHQQGDTST